MDTVDSARAKMLACLRPLNKELASLDVAVGRTLAETLSAARDQPPFPASAMDGYAVRASDLPLQFFAIVGEAAAGKAHESSIGLGEAVRIFTGAPVPRGADVVVPQERTKRDGKELWLDFEALPGKNIREVGIDFRAGDHLVAPGTRLRARHTALIAAAGIAAVKVTRKPRVALLATGTEIVRPGAYAGPYQIYDSITIGLGAMINDWGGEVVSLPAQPDKEAGVAAAVSDAIPTSDLVVIAGGASVGEYDIAKQALGSLGLKIAVPQIAIRPGKPTWFGTIGDMPVLGLPGNPAAAFVCANVFLHGLLDALLACDALARYVRAELEGQLDATGANEAFLRGHLRASDDARLLIRPSETQDSSLVSIFAAANALIRRPPAAAAARSGDLLDVMPLDSITCQK